MASINSQFDVIVLGDYCLDLIFTGLDSFPQLGKEVEAKGFSMVPGGACNVALALHRLGVKTSWAVEFGTDELSQFVLQTFRSEKFPEDLFVFSEKSVKKITVSLSYPQERAFIAYYEPGKMIKTAIKGLGKGKAKIIVIPGLFLGPALKTGSLVAKIKKMDIFMDGNNSLDLTIDDKFIQEMLHIVRFFSLNSEEAQRLTQKKSMEEAAKCLGEYCPTVLIKDGPNGAWCFDHGKIYFDPAIAVKAQDTTGAGDCFNAGFLKAYLSNKPIPECLHWGNVAGGLSTQAPGGTGYKLSESKIQEVIKREKK